MSWKVASLSLQGTICINFQIKLFFVTFWLPKIRTCSYVLVKLRATLIYLYVDVLWSVSVSSMQHDEIPNLKGTFQKNIGYVHSSRSPWLMESYVYTRLTCQESSNIKKCYLKNIFILNYVLNTINIKLNTCTLNVHTCNLRYRNININPILLALRP